MANKKISVADLEFDGIKQNLKTFLQGQSKFSDYDFEGSNMAILLDLLAYNTHYNALYSNMALNELFLDSATKRSSVVSLATALGYTPRSYKCSKVVTNFTVSGVSLTSQGIFPNTITLPRYTPFSGIKDSTRYTFYTKEALTASKTVSNTYVFNNVELIEGVQVISNFEYNLANNNFIIPNKNVDLSTLNVRVQEGGGAYVTYAPANLQSQIDGNSTVYFIKEVDELFSITFGDDILGRQPDVGAFITVSYFISSGEDANGIRLLTYSGDPISGGTVSNITILSPSNGGRNLETIDEIKFNAPNLYAAQNRAITAADYEAILLSKVPEIEAVSVWGGETNVPPVYGKVFICAKTVSGRNLTDSEIQYINLNVLNNYKLVSIIPEFVNPTIIEILPDIVLYYEPASTTKTPQELITLATTSSIQYDEDNLQKFKKIFRSNELERIIEQLDASILSVVVRMRLKFNVQPVFNVNTNYTFSMGNPVAENTLKSNIFYETASNFESYISDNGSGVLQIHRKVNSVFTYIRDVGTIDYETATISIQNLYINSFTNSDLIFNVVPATQDIVGLNNNVIQFNQNQIVVNVIADNSNNRNSTSYTFTNSRLR